MAQMAADERLRLKNPAEPRSRGGIDLVHDGAREVAARSVDESLQHPCAAAPPQTEAPVVVGDHARRLIDEADAAQARRAVGREVLHGGQRTHRVADEQHAVEQVVVDELRDVAAEPRQRDGFAGQRPRRAVATRIPGVHAIGACEPSGHARPVAV